MWITVAVMAGVFPTYPDSTTAPPQGSMPQPDMMNRLSLILVILDSQFCSLSLRKLSEVLLNFSAFQSVLLDLTDVPKGEGTPKWQAYLFAVLFLVP